MGPTSAGSGRGNHLPNRLDRSLPGAELCGRFRPGQQARWLSELPGLGTPRSRGHTKLPTSLLAERTARPKQVHAGECRASVVAGTVHRLVERVRSWPVCRAGWGDAVGVLAFGLNTHAAQPIVKVVQNPRLSVGHSDLLWPCQTWAPSFSWLGAYSALVSY